MDLHQRTAAVVHLDRLAANIENIRRRLKPGVDLMAVVKADGYGHGIPGILPTLLRCGVERFAVAIWEEGVSLRQSGAETEPVLILGDTREEQYPELIRYRLTPTIFSRDAAEKLDALAREANVVQPIHIKLDTGMHRIGFIPSPEAIEDICAIASLPNVEITGVFTHFPRADELDRPETEQQFDLFCRTVETLKERGVSIPFAHTASSPSILLRPDVHLNAVRAGDVLYGLCLLDEDAWPELGLQEVLTWETYVVLVKKVPAGTQIGYGGTCVTTRPTVMATIPVGFADGYDRHLSNRGAVMIRGQEAPILGRVCMDQFMVDVTDIPGVTRGDAVTLLGEGMSILRMANLLDQNVDEVVCHISKRVPRIYVES